LVATLQRAGVPALGLSGEDGALIAAAPAADARLGEVGELGGATSRVDGALLELLLGAGYCPVVSPVSSSAAEPGRALNVNGDDAAAAVAGALGAAELLFVADVPGVLAGGQTLGTVDVHGARSLIAGGTAAGGMAAKLEAALAALAAGVPRVRVGDAAMLADRAAGTAVVGGTVAGTVGTQLPEPGAADAAPAAV
jgi:acetylglutamate kinase